MKNSKATQRRMRRKYPGFKRKFYETAVFEDETFESKDDYILKRGRPEDIESHFENPSNKAYGQAYLIIATLTWFIGIMIGKVFGLHITSSIVVTTITAYFFWIYPNSMIVWKIKRKTGRYSEQYNKYKKDLW